MAVEGDHQPSETELPSELGRSRSTSWLAKAGRLALANLSLVATLGIAALALLRVLILTKGDLSTAQGVIRYVGPAQIVLGLIPTLMPALLLWVTAEVGAEMWVSRRWLRFFSPLLLLATIALFTQSIVFLILTVVMFLTIGYIARKEAGGRTEWRPAAWFALASALYPLVGGVSSWLPLERLDVGAPKPMIGYVLRDGSGPVVIPKKKPRELVFVKPEEIKSRNTCAGGSNWFRSLPDIADGPRAKTSC